MLIGRAAEGQIDRKIYPFSAIFLEAYANLSSYRATSFIKNYNFCRPVIDDLKNPYAVKFRFVERFHIF